MLKRILRFLKGFYFKILRSQQSEKKISFAVALGIFVGCFIPPGLHTLVVLALAFIFRVDKLISFATTWIANPYTMPLIYPVFCFIGSRVIDSSLTFGKIEHLLLQSIKDSSWDNFKFIGEELFYSFLIGGFISGLILGLIGYLISYYFLKVYRVKKAKRRNERRAFYKMKTFIFL